jgi:hypothetical protein
VGLTSSGVLAPVVPSPTEAGVLAGVAFSGLTGVALGAFRLDLPRRGLGLVHAAALGAIAAAAFLAAVGIGPAAWNGEWTPAPPEHVRTVDQVAALLSAEAEQRGAFRALWMGDSWGSGALSGARPRRDYVLTGARGQVLTDLFEVHTDADDDLERVLASIEEGVTDRGGRLLGAFNIRFVVLEPGVRNDAWLGQRDLAVVREEPDYLILETRDVIARAALYDELPPGVTAVATGRLEPASPVPPAAEEVDQIAAYAYAGRVEGPGTLFLAETKDAGWNASVEGEPLSAVGAGWANAFVVPASAVGTVHLDFPRSTEFVAWLIGIGLGWIVVVGAAFSIGAPPRPHSRRLP